jgi:nucleotide-binding universal stress UspA family protein
MATVLLPVTGHDRWTRAVATVVTDVEDDGTDAIVLYPFTGDDVESTTRNLDVDPADADLDALAERKSGVSEAREVLADGGIECRVRGIRAPEDGDGILSVADAADADRIYMYSRRRSPAGKAVFGSALQNVIQNSDVPVVVTPASAL